MRQAALQALVTARGAPPPDAFARLRGRLTADDWTFVRAGAARAIGALPASVEADRTLVAALRDPSPDVRVEILDALASHHATREIDAVRAKQDDADEFTEVRAHAVGALASMCDAKSVDAWTELAMALRFVGDDRNRRLGAAAVDALGALHPKDIAKRLAPLLTPEVAPSVRELARAAMAHAGECGG